MSALRENAITRLITASSVDMNSSTQTIIFPVPSDKKCIVTHLIIRNASISLTTASFSFGYNTGVANNVLANAAYTALVDGTLYTVAVPKNGAAVGNGGDNLFVLMNTPQGAAATTTIEVFGYLF